MLNIKNPFFSSKSTPFDKAAHEPIRVHTGCADHGFHNSGFPHDNEQQHIRWIGEAHGDHTVSANSLRAAVFEWTSGKNGFKKFKI